jgi:hypothetical protein
MPVFGSSRYSSKQVFFKASRHAHCTSLCIYMRILQFHINPAASSFRSCSSIILLVLAMNVAAHLAAQGSCRRLTDDPNSRSAPVLAPRTLQSTHATSGCSCVHLLVLLLEARHQVGLTDHALQHLVALHHVHDVRLHAVEQHVHLRRTRKGQNFHRRCQPVEGLMFIPGPQSWCRGRRKGPHSSSAAAPS